MQSTTHLTLTRTIFVNMVIKLEERLHYTNLQYFIVLCLQDAKSQHVSWRITSSGDFRVKSWKTKKHNPKWYCILSRDERGESHRMRQAMEISSYWSKLFIWWKGTLERNKLNRPWSSKMIITKPYLCPSTVNAHFHVPDSFTLTNLYLTCLHQGIFIFIGLQGQ